MHKRGSTAQYNFENLQLTEVFRDILRKSTFNYSHAAPADTLGVLFTLFFLAPKTGLAICLIFC